MVTPPARSPRTVADADDGENGPGSASDKLVARKVGNRGSIGVSNSPLSASGPANLGTTPSLAGASTAGRSWILASRQGSDITRLATVTLPRTANAKSSTDSSEFHAGRNPPSSRSGKVFINGALRTNSSSTSERTRPRSELGTEPSGTIGRP